MYTNESIQLAFGADERVLTAIGNKLANEVTIDKLLNPLRGICSYVGTCLGLRETLEDLTDQLDVAEEIAGQTGV